jgi:hypothetical protein
MTDQGADVLLSVDAEYLHQYIRLIEGFLNREHSLRDAHDNLGKLNEEFKDRVSTKILKTSVPGWSPLHVRA